MDRRWIVLGAVFLARMAMGFQFQSVASTAPHLIAELRIGYTEIGTLIGLYMLPGVVIAFPGGLIGARFGDKSICAAGLALMLLGGALMGVSASYPLLFAGRLVSGIGAVLFNLVLTKMVTDWFAGREIVFAMAVVLSSWPFGIAVGLLVEVPLAAAFGWAVVMHTTAGLCALSLALLLALYTSPPIAAGATPARRAPGLGMPSLDAALAAVTAGVIWGLLNVGLVIFFSFVPPLLVEQHASPIQAASYVSIALWVSMVSIPVCGYLVQRSGRADAAIAAFAVAAGLALSLLTTGVWPALLCIAVGLAIGPPPGAIMALPARVLPPPNRAAGLGIFYTVYYVMMAVGPAIAGALRDQWHTAAAAVLFGGGLLAAIALLMPVFRLLSARPAPAG